MIEKLRKWHYFRTLGSEFAPVIKQNLGIPFLQRLSYRIKKKEGYLRYYFAKLQHLVTFEGKKLVGKELADCLIITIQLYKRRYAKPFKEKVFTRSFLVL